MSTTNIELQTVPANAQQISVPVNDALGDIDAMLAGLVTVEFTADVNRTLVRDEYLTSVLRFTDSPSTLTTGRDVIFPARFPQMVVINDTAQTLTLKKSGQTGITVAAGATTFIAAGATDVEEAGGSGGSGMTNPMTTAGDLIVGGSVGTPLRLAIGTDGQVLKVVSGAVAWAADAGGSFTGGDLTSAINWAKAADIASAATTDIGAAVGNFVHVTGTTTITALGTAQAGAFRIVRFAGALTLTHNATSLILPTGANITTAANDSAGFVSEGSGNWRCVFYQRADGTPLSGSGGSLSGFTASLNTASPNNTVNTSALSASGGSTNQDAALVPKGTGAVLAQIPASNVATGNKRGAYSVDWQTQRSIADEVASGSWCFIGGGSRNKATTNHGTIPGGQQNSIASDNGTIGGGGENTIAGTGAGYGTIGGGRLNSIGSTAFTGWIGGGQGNSLSGNHSYGSIAGGLSNNVSASYGQCTGGEANDVSGQGSRAGGRNATDRGRLGCDAWANGQFATKGDAQTGEMILRSDTTNATTEAVTANNSAAGTTNQMLLPNTSAYSVRGHLVVRENATGDCAAFDIRALVRRGANAAATVVVGQTVTQVYADAGATTWAVAVVADTTNGALQVNVTGEASHSLKWVCKLEAVEVVG